MARREEKSGTNEWPVSGRLRRVLNWLSGPWGFLVGLATLISTGLALQALLAGSTAISAEEGRLMDLIPPKLGAHCRPYDPGFSKRYSALVSADVKCEPIDTGPDSLKFHLFTTPEDLDAFIHRQLVEMHEVGVSCTSGDFSYESPWTDFRGRVVGRFLCGDYDGLSRLMWSYDDRLVLASAGARPQGATGLHEWWQRHVRFDGADPPARLRRHLLSLLPASFGECDPIPVLLPMSLAGVICEGGDGITSAGAQLIPNERLLSQYLERRADREGIDNDSCRESPFSYKFYGFPPNYRPHLGWLLCKPESGAQWFEWTALNPHVYAFASRSDNDFVKLYEQWSSSLSLIENLSPPSGDSD